MVDSMQRVALMIYRLRRMVDCVGATDGRPYTREAFYAEKQKCVAVSHAFFLLLKWLIRQFNVAAAVTAVVATTRTVAT